MASSHVAWRRWYRSASTTAVPLLSFPRVVTDLCSWQFGHFGVLSGPGLVVLVGFCRG